jgi:zinc transporter 9
MLIVEQLSSSHAHEQHPHKRRPPGLLHAGGVGSPDSVFDVELAGFEDGADGPSGPHERRAAASGVSATKTSNNAESDLPPSAYPITLGLVLHGLADGLALGMSMLSNGESSSNSYALSLVVFLALAVHKGTYAPSGPTAFHCRSLIFIYSPSPWCSCSPYLPCVHHLSDVDISFTGGVQKALAAVQRIDTSRGYHLLRSLLIFRIEASGRRWHRLAHICEFLVRALRLVHLMRVIPGRKFSLRGNRAAASLP